jgi:hypothetical protein
VITRDPSFARLLARPGILSALPKDRYETEVESWRHVQSKNYEFTIKRLREPKMP